MKFRNFCLLGMLVLFGFGCTNKNQSQPTKNTSTLGPGTICVKAGGTWKQYPNACGDSCALQRNPESTSCAQVIQDNCDCGPDKCWNGTYCEKN